jgi:hypothetical protein
MVRKTQVPEHKPQFALLREQALTSPVLKRLRRFPMIALENQVDGEVDEFRGRPSLNLLSIVLFHNF